MTKNEMIKVLTGGKRYESLDACIRELGVIAEWIKSAEQVVHCSECTIHNSCYVEESFRKASIEPEKAFCYCGKKKEGNNNY